MGFAVKYLGLVMLWVGASLLAVASIGHWTRIGDYGSAPPREWEMFDPDLARAVTSFSMLLESTRGQVSAQSGGRGVMDVLYHAVAVGFTHQEARHAFLSNWILYGLGKLHPTFSHIWDPGLMVAKGHSLLCDQSSYLLLSLALANGIRARHVGLHGHVVMEAWYDSNWHLYDPDMEVVPANALGQVLSVEELALSKGLLKKYYGKHNLEGIVGSREDNTYVSLPVGSRFDWKGNVLAYFEKLMETAKFAVPMVMMVIGLLLAVRPMSRSV